MNEYGEIYNEELAHVVMDAEKTRPRRADGIAPV